MRNETPGNFLFAGTAEGNDLKSELELRNSVCIQMCRAGSTIFILFFLSQKQLYDKMAAAVKAILVTGGNSGIGLALCQQLLVEYGCQVFMGSRDVSRGLAALASLGLDAATTARCTVVQVDLARFARITRTFFWKSIILCFIIYVLYAYIYIYKYTELNIRICNIFDIICILR